MVFSLTSGDYNTAIGFTSGTQNTAVGLIDTKLVISMVLLYTIGYYNIAIGNYYWYI